MIADSRGDGQQPAPRRRAKRKRGDWVRLYRRLLRSPIFADPHLLKIAIWALLRARFVAGVVTIRNGGGFAEVPLEAGQFVSGRHAAARELGMAPSSFRRRLVRLAAVGFLALKVDRSWTIVTVNNWTTYQGGSRRSGRKIGHGADTKEERYKNGVIRMKTGAESGAYAAVDEEMLRSPASVEAWRRAAHDRYGVLGSEADHLYVQAAAVHALRAGGNPAAMFVSNLIAGREYVTGDDDEAGRQRLLEIDRPCRSTVHGALGIDPGSILRSVES